MKAVSKVWRRDFATITQLEHQCYALLKPLCILMLVGGVMFFSTFLVWLAVPVMTLSSLGMVGVFCWMIHLQKTPTREIRCPYCDSKAKVFAGVTAFDCDSCDRPISFNEHGVPIAADGSLTQSKPTSVWEV